MSNKNENTSPVVNKIEQIKQLKSMMVFISHKIYISMRYSAITIGRKPKGIIASCIIVALNILNVESSKIDLKKLFELICVSPKTVIKRLNELKNSTEPNVTVLDMLTFSKKDKIEMLPPSYLKRFTIDLKSIEPKNVEEYLTNEFTKD